MKVLKTRTATNLREELFDTLREVSEGEPQLITHRSGDEVVLISRKELNQLLKENEVLKSIEAGRSEIRSGKGVAHTEVKRRLQQKIKTWRKQR